MSDAVYIVTSNGPHGRQEIEAVYASEFDALRHAGASPLLSSRRHIVIQPREDEHPEQPPAR